MSQVELIGAGAQVAGWFNTHAKRVTAARVAKFQQALPEARLCPPTTLLTAALRLQDQASVAAHPPRRTFALLVVLRNSMKLPTIHDSRLTNHGLGFADSLTAALR